MDTRKDISTVTSRGLIDKKKCRQNAATRALLFLSTLELLGNRKIPHICTLRVVK